MAKRPEGNMSCGDHRTFRIYKAGEHVDLRLFAASNASHGPSAEIGDCRDGGVGEPSI